MPISRASTTLSIEFGRRFTRSSRTRSREQNSRRLGPPFGFADLLWPRRPLIVVGVAAARSFNCTNETTRSDRPPDQPWPAVTTLMSSFTCVLRRYATDLRVFLQTKNGWGICQQLQPMYCIANIHVRAQETNQRKLAPTKSNAEEPSASLKRPGLAEFRQISRTSTTGKSQGRPTSA